MANILGIETSCDETAAAVVEDRSRVRSNVVASQIDIHRAFGGVVPEIAARHHIEAIGPVIEQALERAGTTLDGIDAVAVTRGPGLIGSLLVGFSAAKAIAWQRGVPLLGVNHLEGHLRSVFIEHPEIEFPVLGLIVSGGHSSLYLCPAEGVYRLVARTRDDAAGEAFDKVAKLLGLGYPGGPVIERLSESGDDRRYTFPQAQMKDGSPDFSFSGLKTAVRRKVHESGVSPHLGDPAEASRQIRDLVAGFQRAVVSVLVRRTIEVARRESVRNVIVSGGVACNGRLRRDFERAATKAGIAAYFPSPQYTTDNAAMIAAAGFLHFERGENGPTDLKADAGLKL